jgi:ACDE family multidrug resistance protein
MRTYVAIISLASVGVTLGVQAVSPALPEIKRVFELSNSQVGWIVTTYVLPGVVLTVPMGVLGDAIGRRRLFSIALVAYGLAAIVQGAVGNYPLLLAMRTVQGACFAAAMPLTITLLGDAFSGARRIRALAGRNAVLTCSEVVLPLGGALLGAFSWRAPLFVQAITIPLALYSFRILEEHQVRSRAKRTYARDLLHVLRRQQGMFAVLLTAFSRYFYKLLLLAYLPVLLVSERNASLTQVGIVVSFGSLVAVITTTRVPAMIQRIPPSAGATGSIVILSLSTAAFSITSDWRWALLVAAAYGVGDGIIAVLQDTYAIHTSRSHVRAGMVSISQTARNLGKLVSPLAMTAIVAVSSVRVGFLVMAALGLLMAPVLLQLRSMDSELQATEYDRAAEPAQSLDEAGGVPYE